MGRSLDFDAYYVCPDCKQVVQGYELQYPLDSGAVIYVCPKCGVIQEKSEVERQLGKNEEE